MARAEDLFEQITKAGAEGVEALIRSEVTEELFLDYKRSADNGSATRLNETDRANFGKAVSGFGNSEGGVIVWGVDCRNDPARGDVPSGAVPIQNPTRFKSWLEACGSGLTVPPHGTIKHQALQIGGGDTGFVVSLIPSGSNPPYQITKDSRYLIRAGSNFLPVPHAVLAGMFGRRPQPKVFHMYVMRPATIDMNGVVELKIGVEVVNTGLCSAEDVFLNLTLYKKPGENCELGLPKVEDPWAAYLAYDTHVSLMTKPNFKLPPEARIPPYHLSYYLRPPFDQPIAFAGLCGCTGAPLNRFLFRVPVETLERAYQVCIEERDAGGDLKVVGRKFSDTLFEGAKSK